MAGRTVAKRFCAVKRRRLGLAILTPLAAQDPAEPLGRAPHGIDRFEAIAPRPHDQPVRNRAGFEILRRETTDPPWSVYDFVDASRAAALKGVWKDNPFFAERAVGRNGARSIPVAAALKPSALRVPAK